MAYGNTVIQNLLKSLIIGLRTHAFNLQLTSTFFLIFFKKWEMLILNTYWNTLFVWNPAFDFTTC